MNGERRILEHRVQIPAVRRRRQEALEGIRRGDREQQEPEAHEAEHTHDAAGESSRAGCG